MEQEGKIKLTPKQKEVVRKLRDGYSLFENTITPGAKWQISKNTTWSSNWGNVHGVVINGLSGLIQGQRINTGVFRYQLTELGRKINID